MNSKTPKPIIFLGGSLDDLRAFPQMARGVAGFQLHRVQHGAEPDDWKPMNSIGAGVREIRVRDPNWSVSRYLRGKAQGRDLRAALLPEEVTAHEPKRPRHSDAALQKIA